jgi:hypothetical protein
MKQFFTLAFVAMSLCSWAQSSATTLDVVSWNLEWFGSNTEGPADNDLQEANALRVLRILDADLYGMVEIVDTMRFRRLVDSLGPQYAFVIAPYCSGNATGAGSSWMTCQKLAFIYNRTLFSNVRARGMMRNSPSAYNNWASGRLPFLLNADVTINNTTRNMNFILIHGKAGASVSDYNRRRDGAQELKDTLDAHFSSQVNFIIGDYNDALNTTICTDCGTNISSFDVIVRDSTDNDHYKSVTLPLSAAGQSSMTNYPNVVDNHVVSNEVATGYIAGSARIRTDIAATIINYGHTTSDHYPVSSHYTITGMTTGLPHITARDAGIEVFPIPFQRKLELRFSRTASNVTIRLTDVTGRILHSQVLRTLVPSTSVVLPTAALTAGIYFIVIRSSLGFSTVKVVKE